ncbi:protein kinase STUNTED-like isoform X2 [Aristolochia californica]|uniref:protein kinase STUNTED-like isoform X2 n=1 Tax=Aristolochia californica TaxID=171875 RepID=UPI0035DBEF9A
MKMKRLESFREEEENSTNRTVVVGVKLDQPSKELLTWALVKVSQPGDRVIALHVLSTDDLLDRNGQSSLLSLVKAFDSVLAVYEGFCNLKQVDLKLKICRGSSVRKVLVREAKSYGACKVILGVSKVSPPIGSWTTIAKYCGRKLPRDCWVLAVNNGKVVFQREANTTSGHEKGNEQRPSRFFGAIHRTLSKRSKTSNVKLLEYHPSSKDADYKKNNNDPESNQNSRKVSDSTDGLNGIPVSNSSKKKCSICAPFSILPGDSLCHGTSESAEANSDRSTEGSSIDDSLALVPVHTSETSSISLLVKEVPERRPGWPLLRRAILPHRHAQVKSSNRQISVVQWAMRLPSRHLTAAIHPDHNKQAKPDDFTTICLDGKSGAMVLVGDPVSTTLDEIHREGTKIIPKELESLHEKYSSTCRLFSYQELVQATSNFSPEYLIGKGGSSKVYKGYLPDGKELAVKILKSSVDVVKEFILEIEIITTLTHKNVISLFGFCFEDNNLLMVYDFLSRGSLEENLHGEKGKNTLGWGDRYKVALGVAEALDYLHSRAVQPVIHRDVKSSNILLADDFDPQLSDFGLAKWASVSSIPITCNDVAGTFGYLAPEYFMYGKVTDKIDVYAFGVVLLELLSGRKPISNEHPKGQESLVMWAKPILQGGKYMQLLDLSLKDTVDSDQIERMAMAASLCIRRAPRFRPCIGLILKLLQGDEEVSKWAKLQISSSAEEFDGMDDESAPASIIQSHLNLALLDVEDDSLSISSTEPTAHYLTANKSWEDYLQGRWSRTSSFD